MPRVGAARGPLVVSALACFGGAALGRCVRGGVPFAPAALRRPTGPPPRARALACASPSADAPGARAERSFTDFGLHPVLAAALERLDLSTPTPIQADAFPAVRDPDLPDVIIAGETGIGKTLAYLLPALDALLGEAADGARGPSWAEGDDATQPEPDPGLVLVVQPNADLSFQAHRVAAELLRDCNLEAACLADPATDPGRAARAHVLVGTAAKVLGHADVRRARFAVLDEVDSLLAGSFKLAARQKYPIEQLLLALRQEKRRRAQLGGAAEADGAEDGDAPAPARPLQHLLVGATVPAYGTRNVRAHVTHLFPAAVWVESSGLHRTKPELAVSFVRVGDEAESTAAHAAAGPRARAAHPEDGEDAALGGVGGQPVMSAARDEALVRAVGEPSACPPTLVFANTVAIADRGAAVLSAAGVRASPFHKKLAVAERQRLLAEFSAGGLQALVSTGLAARGLDLAAVEHVVEYTLAPNVVEHLHRLGRTARAKRAGRATCLYGAADEDLVAAIREGAESGAGISGAFSRKRSFRLRLKKKRRAAEGADGGAPAPKAGRAPRRAAQGPSGRALGGAPREAPTDGASTSGARSVLADRADGSAEARGAAGSNAPAWADGEGGRGSTPPPPRRTARKGLFDDAARHQ